MFVSARAFTLTTITLFNLLPVVLTPAFAGGPGIRWEIENRFRYFKKASDFRAFVAVYDQLKKSSPTPSVLDMERALENGALPGSNLHDGWAASIYKDTCGRQPDHTHSSCRTTNDEPYLVPVSSMTANLILYADGFDAATCEWRIDGVVVDTKLCGTPAMATKVQYGVDHQLEVRPSSGTPQSMTIKLSDVLIVSFGDSFSAGEGNPEKAVRLLDGTGNDYGNSDPGKLFPTRVEFLESADKTHFLEDTSADWSNVECHRSLYSHHTRAALQYALENPHVSVTFLNYSCSGAAVYEGILNAWWAHQDVQRGGFDDAPQLVKALRDLCKETAPYKGTNWATDGHHDDDYNTKPANIVPCKSRVRDVDVLLLSIGGNDVGFVNMIAAAVLNGSGSTRAEKARASLYGFWRQEAGPQSFADGRKASNHLPERYEELNKFVTKELGVPSEKIILSAYPQIFYQADGGQLCAMGNSWMDVHAIFGVKNQQTFSDGTQFVDYLAGVMERAAKAQRWLFADQHAKNQAPNSFANDDKGLGHGICAAAPPGEVEAAVKFPRPSPNSTPPDWQPPLANWRPYSNRYRWFVTPNDAFLTDNEHEKDWDLIDPAQPLYAATYSGAFHPNALGQAALADSVLLKLRDVLGNDAN
jgi:hypothetical protein